MPVNSLLDSLQAVLVLGVVAGCLKPSDEPLMNPRSVTLDLAASLKDQGALDNAMAAQVNDTIQYLLSRSRFKCVVVNAMPTNEDCLLIYLAKPFALSTKRQVCGYAGSNTIFCDTGFLASYLDSIQALDTKLDRATQYRAFHTWVLGHEIAHADLRHPVGHFLITTGWKFANQKEAIRAQKLEYDADKRFAALAEMKSSSLSIPVEAVLVNVFNAAYRDKWGLPEAPGQGLAIEHDPSIQWAYPLSDTDPHPHMTFRTAQLLLLTSGSVAVRSDAEWFLARSAPGIMQMVAGESDQLKP